MGDNKNVSPIKTVVVLVMENRSFDHMFGWMKPVNPNIDGLTGQESNLLDTKDPNSERINVGDGSVYVDSDPAHTFQDIYEQIYGEPWSQESEQKKLAPTMQGFAQNAYRTKAGMEEAVMNGFKPDLLPVYKELMTQFAVCDRWFCSLPTCTQPNRLYVHSATSYGLSDNDNWKLIAGMPQKTIFDSLVEAGLTFGIYFQYFPNPLFYQNLRRLKYYNNFRYFDRSFKKDCKAGTLPNYVVIEPRYYDLLRKPANDDHPSHDVSRGQNLVKEVYEALRSSPQWNETLLVIVYDEHGGFYDHVPPPTEGVPSPDGIVGPKPCHFKFDRLGVRVPALFISPWIEPGTVLHAPSGPQPTSQYEHSSIPATTKKIFNLKDFLNERDAWAGTFDVVLNRTTPRTDCPVTLPDPPILRNFEAKGDNKLSEFQQDLVQLAAKFKRCDLRTKDMIKAYAANITVADAAQFCEDAFKDFIDECKKAEANGEPEDTVVVVNSYI